jgi:hypothetical protein
MICRIVFFFLKPLVYLEVVWKCQFSFLGASQKTEEAKYTGTGGVKKGLGFRCCELVCGRKWWIRKVKKLSRCRARKPAVRESA